MRSLAELAGEEWREALAAAPRELFVPGIAWTTQDGLIDRETGPDLWRAAVKRDDAIITQIDDGATELTAQSPWRARSWSSSCSAPTMVFDFLRLLAPYPGDRIMEVGTGTGWTTALLSAKLGAEQVTSIEVDAQVAKQAAASLDAAGFAPHLLVGDGAFGVPDGAPFDRVHATCAVASVPYAWVEQSRAGGIIACPWTPNTSGGHKLCLTVTGPEAVGRFAGDAAFMLLRAQRPPVAPIGGDLRESGAAVDPRRIDRAGAGFQVAVAAMMPGVVISGTNRPDGAHRMSARHAASDSHALAVGVENSSHADVQQRGPRDLWRELEAAYLAWLGWGAPGRERFGVTIAPEGQRIWLDRPDNPIAEVETDG